MRTIAHEEWPHAFVGSDRQMLLMFSLHKVLFAMSARSSVQSRTLLAMRKQQPAASMPATSAHCSFLQQVKQHCSVLEPLSDHICLELACLISHHWKSCSITQVPALQLHKRHRALNRKTCDLENRKKCNLWLAGHKVSHKKECSIVSEAAQPLYQNHLTRDRETPCLWLAGHQVCR